jgi:hypothetical protein
MHEYAFDVKLAAVVRVTAANPAEALRIVQNDIDAISLDTTGQASSGNGSYHLTEASVDDCSPTMFEIDGKEAPWPCPNRHKKGPQG